MAPQVIISATLGIRSFLGSTARMEARSKHNNLHGPGWATLPEAKRHGQQIQEVNRQRRVWKGLKLPWVNIGVSGGLGPKSNPVPIIPIGFGETIALAPLKLFGHLATGGAASMVKPPLGGARVRLLRLLRACLAARGGARVARHSWERGLATALPALPQGLALPSRRARYTFDHPEPAELLGTAVLHLASRKGFFLKRAYLEASGLWQSNAPFDNATMPPEDAQVEATRGVARFNATFLDLDVLVSAQINSELELEGQPAQGAHKKAMKRKVERKEGRSRRGKEYGKKEGDKLRETLGVKLREKRARGQKPVRDDH